MPQWRTPELDEAASQALAMVTLYASGHDGEAALASRLLDQLAGDSDGIASTVGGLVSVCSSLLVLLEFDTGAHPEESLARVGQLIAQASMAPVTPPSPALSSHPSSTAPTGS